MHNYYGRVSLIVDSKTVRTFKVVLSYERTRPSKKKISGACAEM